jgi:hypothetical protein
MGQNKQLPECVLGFYLAVEHAHGEISGGILITSHQGRPIEFQCSLPVRPNATQQTLYGKTLRPFLVGELIAGALRDKLDARPHVLFVNDPDAINVPTWGQVPVFCFTQPAGNAIAASFRKGTFWHDPAQAEQVAIVLQLLEKHVPEAADLREPLLRVEQALKEALGQAA